MVIRRVFEQPKEPTNTELRIYGSKTGGRETKKRGQKMGQIGYAIKQLRRSQDEDSETKGVDNLINWFTDGN